MRVRLSSSRENQSGFTLVEVVVGLAVGMFLLVSTFQLLTYTLGVVSKLNVQRNVRDNGIMAVETIEREFRKTLEYGGSFVISSSGVTASYSGASGARAVAIQKNGDKIQLTVDGKSSSFPGTGTCTSFGVKALVGNSYVSGSDLSAKNARAILIEFELRGDKHDITRAFKAAFSSANAKGV